MLKITQKNFCTTDTSKCNLILHERNMREHWQHIYSKIIKTQEIFIDN